MAALALWRDLHRQPEYGVSEHLIKLVESEVLATTIHQQREALDEEDRQIDGGRPARCRTRRLAKPLQYRLVVLEEKPLRGKRLVMGTIVDQFGKCLTDGIQLSRQHDQL